MVVLRLGVKDLVYRQVEELTLWSSGVQRCAKKFLYSDIDAAVSAEAGICNLYIPHFVCK